jgi:hypothetical protein
MQGARARARTHAGPRPAACGRVFRGPRACGRRVDSWLQVAKKGFWARRGRAGRAARRGRAARPASCKCLRAAGAPPQRAAAGAGGGARRRPSGGAGGRAGEGGSGRGEWARGRGSGARRFLKSARRARRGRPRTPRGREQGPGARARQGKGALGNGFLGAQKGAACGKGPQRGVERRLGAGAERGTRRGGRCVRAWGEGRRGHKSGGPASQTRQRSAAEGSSYPPGWGVWVLPALGAGPLQEGAVQGSYTLGGGHEARGHGPCKGCKCWMGDGGTRAPVEGGQPRGGRGHEAPPSSVRAG